MASFDAGAALCAPFLRTLPADGLSIMVASATGARSTVGTTDAVAARLDELQFELGEGPTPDVLLLGHPVLAPDLLLPQIRRDWPLFGAAALGAGAAAMFTFPMLIGVLTVGAVSMYSCTVQQPWSADLRDAAARLATDTVRPALELAANSATANERDPLDRSVELRREVHQASGILMIQLDCSIDDALSRLRAYAFSHARPIDEVARDVVAGALDIGADDA